MGARFHLAHRHAGSAPTRRLMMESTLDPRIAAVSGVLIAAAFLLMLITDGRWD
jgi:hypothetical protein